MLCSGYTKTADEMMIGIAIFGPMLVAAAGLYIGCIVHRWVRMQRRAARRRQIGGRVWAPAASVASPLLALATRGAPRRNSYAISRSWDARHWR